MDATRPGRRRRLSSTQLLIAAGVALAVLAIAVTIYPRLVAAGASDVLVEAIGVVGRVCLAGVVFLPIAAIIRRLTRAVDGAEVARGWPSGWIRS